MPRKSPRRPFPNSPNHAQNCRTYRKKLAARSLDDIQTPHNKTCPRCSTKKPAASFGKCTTSLDGMKPLCRACKKAEYEKRRDELAVKVRVLPEEKTCSKCRETKPRSMFSLATVSRDGLESRCKACIKAQFLRWYPAAAPRLVIKAREWAKKNPEKVAVCCRQQERNRRARKSGASGRLDNMEWGAILKYFNHTCAYCLRHETVAGKMTIEHMLPLSRGGAHEPENVVPACKRCNSSKHARTLIEFIARNAPMII